MPSFTEYTLNDKTYVDLKQLMPLRPYAANCKSLPHLIRKHRYQDIINGQVKDGVLIQREKRSFKYGSVYVSKTEILELFEEDTPAIVEYQPAPAIIEDEDLVFFKDDEGVEYDVLMRGERTRQGIYFKAKDVERVFEMKRFDITLGKEHTNYILGRDYQWFTLPIVDIIHKGRGKELYLTYPGLKHAIEASRSGVGFKFKEWIDEIVFASAFGTVDQKAKTFARVLNVDADHLAVVMSKTDGEVSCLYLIDIKQTKDERRVFKYGYTKHLRSRFREHMKKYGDNIELIKFAFVPEMNLSRAETQIRGITKPFAYECEGEKELIALDDKEVQSVLLAYKAVATSHCGQLKEIVDKYESDAREMRLVHMLELSEREKTVSDTQRECAAQLHAAEVKAIIAAKDLEILQMKVRMLEAQLST